jgi:hypothetical protein
MTRQEHAALKIEQKEKLLAELQLLVIKYERSVLSSCSAWQELQMSLDGVRNK